jgi:threonine synthase
MDISKASNFERFIYDLTGQDGNRVAELWREVDSGGAFSLAGTDLFAQVSTRYGFQSGRSTHADRLNTIRACRDRHNRLVDTHTADGLKVAWELRDPTVPMVVLETALPTKFEETMVEALGERPPRPAGLENLESLPQRSQVMDVDVDAVKALIAAADAD